MRVLYISSVYKPAYVYGGPARSVPSLCEGLAESGADIEVLTTNAHRRTRLDVPLNRRLEVEWDAALVCSWMVTTDRTGVKSYQGMNFMGQSIIEAGSPERALGVGWKRWPRTRDCSEAR